MIAAAISRHHWTCDFTHFKGFLWNQPVLRSLASLTLLMTAWRHSSGFSRGILTDFLIGLSCSVIDSPESSIHWVLLCALESLHDCSGRSPSAPKLVLCIATAKSMCGCCNVSASPISRLITQVYSSSLLPVPWWTIRCYDWSFWSTSTLWYRLATASCYLHLDEQSDVMTDRFGRLASTLWCNCKYYRRQ